MTYYPTVGDGAQALDLGTLYKLVEGNAVLGGLGVSINSGALDQADTLSVASGTALVDGAEQTVGATSVGINAASNDPRKDIVYIDGNGAVQVAEGQEAEPLPVDDDTGVHADDLDRYDDPLEARSLVKTDDDGRYRPLKTAPSLPHGWVFPELNGRACAETVEYVYPATIANWHLERQGTLDVDHWRETVERQSGIYGVVKTWDRGDGYEHVNWVAEACCDDSQCLKRREWEYDDETDLDVDGGDGTFPCREPCSLVIAGARTWTRLEGEAERTYEFTLTPSEKEQVEAIVDAVADGRAEEIREADMKDGANRYRARFLRAKRFDEDGNLSGTPTDRDE